MSSGSNASDLSSNDSSNYEQSGSSSDEAVGVISSQFLPYMNEPLARPRVGLQDCDSSEEEDDEDIDGLSPSVPKERYEKCVTVESWCKCSNCDDEFLIGSLEFRCCREVNAGCGKLTWDGSIERVSCITQHEDYEALVNKTVLLQVGPLLKDHNGKTYRRH